MEVGQGTMSKLILTLLTVITLITVAGSIIYNKYKPESEIYTVNIESVYANEEGLYTETSSGVFKYPKNGVALYESDTGQDYILRSKNIESDDKIFLTEYTRNELEGK